jgi:hypothetical protein
MIGTPPNDCHCPEGTEFAGYKGCIAKAQPTGPAPKKLCPDGSKVDLSAECPVVAKSPPKEPKKKKPSGEDHPAHDETCMWRGTAPFCKGRCQSGELNRAVSDDGAGTYANFGEPCLTGFKTYCCRLTFPNN